VTALIGPSAAGPSYRFPLCGWLGIRPLEICDAGGPGLMAPRLRLRCCVSQASPISGCRRSEPSSRAAPVGPPATLSAVVLLALTPLIGIVAGLAVFISPFYIS